jgi:protein phosphatase
MGPDPIRPNPLHCNVRWTGITDRGRIRQNNEDAFLALAIDRQGVHHLGKVGESSLESSDFIFAVSDGMGGANAGEFASRIAVDRITRLMARTFHAAAQGLATGFSDILSELYSQVHHDLLRLGNSYEECAGMGATLSLGWLTPGWLYFAHVGDSRIYHLPACGGMQQITHDHTHVGWQRRTGRINEREARTHPGRNSLQQALGAGHQIVDPQIGALTLQPGDRLLLCTDGLVDGLWDRRIEECIREPDPATNALPPASRLVEAAKPDSRDNITALVVELCGRPPGG